MTLLYTFRRCPYAIRARMAIFQAGVEIELQEVSLKHKPQAMLDISAKGTVPVLCIDDMVIDESLDIMLWALSIHDPDAWYSNYSETDKELALQLIAENDDDFKPWLDKYKYADRFPEHSSEYYRQQCGTFMLKLENLLQQNTFLFGSSITLADVAIMPFIRQFSMVDKPWFESCTYPELRNWLQRMLELPLFAQVMAKNQH